jgi:hypothetical protein
MSDTQPLEVPGGFVISEERLLRMRLWAQENRHAAAYIQLWSLGETNVITIVDLYDESDPTLSVTNDAEYVVKLATDTHGDHPVVYRDTEGRWDELRHREGHFACFRILDARTAEEAVDEVLLLHQQDAMFAAKGSVQ